MRVALISYPMLFQRVGGLQIQLLETVSALVRCGVDASLFDWRSDRLDKYDVVHVFGAVNGNHRIVEAAKTAGRRVVLSTVMGPPFSRRDRLFSELGESAIGRLTGWRIHTSYAQIMAALNGADRIIALGDAEREMLCRSYRVPAEKLSVVPNGISHRFFEADPSIFSAKWDIPNPWVVCVASVSPFKNQLSLVRAMSGTGIHVVIVGPVLAENQSYLDQCLAEGEDVTYLGLVDYNDAMLPSIYAAATVYALPSASEVMPLGVLEALAADTPAVVTRNCSLDLADKAGVLHYVDPNDLSAIRKAVEAHIAAYGEAVGGGRADYVRRFNWDDVAADIVKIYESVGEA